MIWSDYVQWTVKTWAHDGPFDLKQQLNCALGIAGEWGEYSRDPWGLVTSPGTVQLMGVEPGPLSPNARAKVLELGDVIYYCARLQLGLGCIADVELIKNMASKTRMTYKVGMVAEYYKKALRGEYEPDPRTVMILTSDVVGGCVDEFVGHAFNFEGALSDILDANVTKLERRLAKNKILGSGDDR